MSKKTPSLVHQAMHEFQKMDCIGQSKKQARIDQNKRNPDGIYGICTMHQYKDITAKYLRDLKAEHPEVKWLADAKQYVPTYLERQKIAGYAPHTIRLRAQALAKLYHCEVKDFKVELPARHHGNITRSRGPAVRDRDYNPAIHQDLETMCRATGCRASDLERPENAYCRDIYDKNGHTYLHIERGKGGRPREVYVPDAYAQELRDLAAGKSLDEKILPLDRINRHCDIHAIRRVYAQELYGDCCRDRDLANQLQADMDAYPHKVYKTDDYICRGEFAGQRYDRQALSIVAVSLGHGPDRYETAVHNYIR